MHVLVLFCNSVLPQCHLYPLCADAKMLANVCTGHGNRNTAFTKLVFFSDISYVHVNQYLPYFRIYDRPKENQSSVEAMCT